MDPYIAQLQHEEDADKPSLQLERKGFGRHVMKMPENVSKFYVPLFIHIRSGGAANSKKVATLLKQINSE